MTHLETVRQCFDSLASIWKTARPLDSFNSQYSGDPERFHTLGIMQMWCEYFIAQFDNVVSIETEEHADEYATVKFEYKQLADEIAKELQAEIDAAKAASDAAAAQAGNTPA